jgi:transglutaminase-like putative cysteine protease
LTRLLRWPQALTHPATGWSSLLLLLGMLALVGVALADSRALAMSGGSGGEGLVLLMLLGGLAGYAVARSSLGLLTAQLAGAAIGALVILAVAAMLAVPGGAPGGGASYAVDPSSLVSSMQRLAITIERDLRGFLVASGAGGPSGAAPANLAFLLLAGLCWTTAQFSSMAVFRHGRAAPAIAASGVLLFLNVALPPSITADLRLPVLPVLAGYSALTMLLVIRLQMAAQADQWARRHVQDPGEARRISRRAGVLFVVVVVAATTSLTVVARAPTQDLDQAWAPLGDLGADLSRWLALVAVDLPPSTAGITSDRLEVNDTWQPGEGVAFEAVVEGGLRGNYWWLSAFADFDGRTWTRDDASEESVPAGQPIDMPLDASAAGPHGVATAVTPHGSSVAVRTLLAPAEPVLVDREVRVRSLGDREGLAEVVFREAIGADETYNVTSASHDYRPAAGTLTAGALRAAGTAYPPWMGRYLRVDAGASGPRTRALGEGILERAERDGRSDPYSLALLLQDHLRELGYRTSVEGLCQAGENVPECLLRTEVGFCQHYASTMAMVLRELAIPARFVNGYLPGSRAEDGTYIVPRAALHAWVEVYFPGTGWVRFDPTPGGQLGRFQQQATAFEEGEVTPSAEPGATGPPDPVAASPSPQATLVPLGDDAPAAGPSGGQGVELSGALSIAAGVAMVAFVMLAVLFLAWLRWLPGADSGLAYGRIVSLASRLGHGPHPSQTELEYAASLGELLPAVRGDLAVVARARVEMRYGHRDVAAGDRSTLRRAYARIRTALLRLWLRFRG